MTITLLLIAASLAQPAPPARPAADSLILALDLPEIAQAMRDNGLPEAEVTASLAAARAAGLSAADTRAALREVQEAMKTRGRIEGLAAFLQVKLGEGLRGQALAEAILAEHAARGLGRPAAGEGAGSKPPLPTEGQGTGAKPPEGGKHPGGGKPPDGGRKPVEGAQHPPGAKPPEGGAPPNPGAGTSR